MRHQLRTEPPSENRSDWKTIKTLIPSLWEYRYRIGLALLLLALAKLANIGVPLALKEIIDTLDFSTESATPMVALPLALLIGYGLLRLSTSLFNELRAAVFARASQSAIRKISLKVFHHLHHLSLRFHLDRQTGGISRDIERGSRSTGQLLNYLIFSILPTLFEISVVCGILLYNYPWPYAAITLITVISYYLYTYKVTTWRTQFRIKMNEMDSRANTAAIDSLINYETVKYFGNEDFESRRYGKNLKEWEQASVKSQTTLALLNIGQGFIISTGLTLIMILAGRGVTTGTMSLGDFVLVNTFLIQIYIPLGFLGTVFREIRHCLTDMEKMFSLLDERQEVIDRPDAHHLEVSDARVAFNDISFSYLPERQILKSISFVIPCNSKVAIVGASGSGKSTLARLLFRFYDVSGGCITIDGQDIRKVTLSSLHQAIGVVPQDTVLFNDTIAYNIGYGNPEADEQAIKQASRLAHLEEFIASLPNGYETRVGERGLKLSGGEKQRIAIARTLLKDPPILILDEATSALDSHAEKAIQSALEEIATNRTTLVIAHRLSTIIDADQILVLDEGRIVERGCHQKLLERDGIYARLWAVQQEQRALTEE